MGVPQARPWERSGSPEALLALFRDTGDPAALGALFDTTAPELFRVATAIVHDPAAAEDAVQETFLAAISASSRFQPGRPVLPWLLGILRRKIGRVRRAGRRPDPLRVPRRELEGTAGASIEEAARVREAVEGLPQPYRAVALLRWRYGLEPSEIAHVRGEPPGTVWAILSRALARLRATLRGGACALLGARAPRGLSFVRQAVLESHAGGTAAVIGASVMTKSAAAMAVVAAAMGGYVSKGVIDPPVRGHVLGPGAASTVATAVDASDVAPSSPAGPALAVATRDAVPSPPTEDPAAGESRGARAGSRDVRKALSEREVDAEIAEMTLRVEQISQVADVLQRPTVATVDALRERVRLGSAQESIVREVVEATQARLLDLRRLPDDQGRTWEQVQAAAVQMVGGALRIDEGESLAFRARRIPGRGEKDTYGSEEVRLLEAANERIRSALTDEQRAAYDAVDPTELFGPLPPGGAPIGWPAELARSLGIDADPETDPPAAAEGR